MSYWLPHLLGIDDASGPWYAFWSGFGGFIEGLPGFAILFVVYRRVNCHASRCHRIGLHHVTGTHFVTCRKHHPVHDGSAPASAAAIARAHKEANP